MAVQPNFTRASCSFVRIHDAKQCPQPRASPSDGFNFNNVVYLGLVVILISFLAILIVFCMASSPCNPSFSVAIAGFNVSGSRLSANWDLNIITNNPNKYAGITYRQIAAYIVYHGAVLAKASLVPFYHQKLNSTIVNILVMESGDAIDTMAGLLTAHQSTGEVQFDVWISAVLQFKTFHNVQRRRFLWFQCNSIRVPNWQAGSAMGSSSQPIKCDNEPLNW